METASGAARNLKNPVEMFISYVEKACRNLRVYAHDPQAIALVALYDAAYEAACRAFVEETEIKISVKAFDMHYDRKVVYVNKDRKTSLSYALYADGIRLLVVRRGISRDEVIELVHILGSDFNSAEMSDQDFYCLFAERELPHFEVVTGDIAQEWKKKDPELEPLVENFFLAVTKNEVKAKANTNPRRLRAKDVEVIEKFKLTPQHFERNEAEVTRIIELMSKSSDHSKKEKETLERLLAMGFHLLSEKDDVTQQSIGKDLVVKVTLMILQAKQFDLFRTVTQKISQEISAVNDDILLTIFDVKNLPFFVQALAVGESQLETAKLFEHALPLSLRVMVHLLGKFPTLERVWGDSLIRSFNSELPWLIKDVADEPDNEAWPYLVHVFSAKPNAHLAKFLELLLKSPKLSLRLKVMRQLAAVGTPEALQTFMPLLRSKREEERLQAYELLRIAHNKLALKMLKDQYENSSFQGMASTEEREQIYSGIFSIAGETSLPWFESLWLQKDGGMFSSKGTAERRASLFKSLSRVNAAATLKLFEKLPAGDVTKEMRAQLDKMIAGQNKGGRS